jgi:TonB family protein
MGQNIPWNDLRNVPAELSLPVAMGPAPILLPPQKPQRRWRWLVAWSLFVFTGGLFAGPLAHDFTIALLKDEAPKLASRVPWLFGWLAPAQPGSQPNLARQPEPVPTRPTESTGAPRIVPIVALAPEPESTTVTPRALGSSLAPAARTHGSRSPGVRSTPGSGRATHSSKGKDPFEDDDPGAETPATARGSRSAPSDDSPVAASEPASKRPAAKSSSSLDNLMAEVTTGSKAESKKSVSRDIDSMLKDVQKSVPPPAAKHNEPAPLEPLTAADISKAMAEVKTKSNACAQRLGQSGTAELKIWVGKEGKVTDARVGGKVANTPLGDCIDRVVRAAAFRPNAGLRFDYRIDAR